MTATMTAVATGNAIPILMYHKVGPAIPGWKWSYLSVPTRVFEDHLRALAAAGWRSATLAELYDHVSGVRALPSKTVVLTFDDGYVDNWTLASRLLAKYGFTGTVYVNPEFVDPREVVRPTLDDVARGAASESELAVRGFLSWPELKQLAQHGPLDVGSHLMTHTWYPTGAEVVDFHRPGDGHYWLDWNAFPDDKPFYLERAGESRVPYGTPVYRHDKSLRATRASVTGPESERLAAFVRERGGAAFFDRAGWRAELEAELARVRASDPPRVEVETADERAARIRWELRESRRVLEERLGTAVPYMAWPGGGYDDTARREAEQVYRAFTLGSADPSRDARVNRPGEDPGTQRRLGVPAFEAPGRIRYPGGRYLVAFLDEYRGARGARRRRQLMKLAHLAGLRLGL